MTQSKTKQCQNCKIKFTIEPEDFEFYKKIDVPEPTFCPDCRSQRRYVVRNERILYRRPCDLCKKDIISMYSSDKPYPVYCPKCYYSDKWDQYSFNQDIDFERPFFEQYKELQNKVPRLSLYGFDSVNSDFCNYEANNKNCYLSFRMANSENCNYCYFFFDSNDCVDSSYVRKSQLLYNCFECRNSYNSRFLVESKDSHDCAYSYDLRNCSNCLFCWNLRNKKYHIKNKPVSKEEFKKAWKEYVSGSRKKTRQAKDKFNQIYQKKAIHKYNKIINCQNVRGINLVNSKNIFEVYNCTESENIRYGNDMEKTKDSMDVFGPLFSEMLYEISSVNFNCYRIFFSSFIDKSCRDVWYSSYLNNSEDCFGCISLKKAKYCIFNKQYSKKEYQQLKDKLVIHMKKTKEFGENIPIKLSPFAYNESTVMDVYPLSKEQALKKGYFWKDDLPGIYGKESIKQKDIPDDIKDVPKDIIKDIIVCVDCGRNYKVIKQELDFYKKHKISFPEKCSDCRYREREQLYKIPRKLIKQRCTCEESDHKHHINKRCPNKFESSYSKKQGKENIWCEECYKYLL